MTTVTVLPDPPSRADPANFSSRGDAFFDALADFSIEANLLGTEISSSVDTVSSGLVASLWANTGATYAIGDKRYSPANGRLYRRLTASSAGTTDPSVDTTNWAPMSVEAPALVVVSGTTQTAVKSMHYEMTNAAQSTLTLPATPSAGDWVWVGFTNDLITNVIARNGQPIAGFASDLTVDWPSAGLILRYINGTYGWRVFK